jgi:hypothetical protein
MEKFILPKLLVIAFGLSFSNTINAQTIRLQCGPERLDSVANKKAMLYAQTNRAQTLPAVLLRVYFHVFADDNGANATLTPAQIETEFTSLVTAYSPANICFVKEGQEFINSTNLNNNFNADTDPNGTQLAPYRISGVINMFYMKNIGGVNAANGGGYGGITLGVPNTYFLVASGNVGDNNTTAHEMGHALGLLHTFAHTATVFEAINGSNGTTAGDLVADTPADPFAYFGQKCYSSTACNYTGSCPDPNNQTNFTPPYSNRMGYWNCAFPFIFTSGQFARINSFLSTNQPLIDCTSPTNFTIAAGSYGAFYFKSAINVLSTGNNAVTMGGIVKASLGAAHVHLLPGFHASPVLNTSFVRIESSPCN